MSPENISSSHLIPEKSTPKIVDKEHIRLIEGIISEANYGGDCVKLSIDRWGEERSKELLRSWTINHYKGNVVEGEQTLLSKTPTKQAIITEVINRVRLYRQRLSELLSLEEFGDSYEYDKHPTHIGKGVYQKNWVVFDDALQDGKPLTDAQASIVGAHELGHAFRSFINGGVSFMEGEVSAIRGCLDKGLLQENLEQHSLLGNSVSSSYLLNPHEIIERLAQIKNYFGQKAADILTLEHLEYAKLHYVSDTGLDNKMSIFLQSLDMPKAVELAKQYPL